METGTSAALGLAGRCGVGYIAPGPELEVLLHGGTYAAMAGLGIVPPTPLYTLTCLYRGFHNAWAELGCSLELRLVTCLCGWTRLRCLALALRICTTPQVS